MFIIDFIVALFWILFLPLLIVLIISIYCACALSSRLSRQEEWEEMQRKLREYNKK